MLSKPQIADLRQKSIAEYAKAHLIYDAKTKKYYHPARKDASMIFTIDESRNIFFDFVSSKGSKGFIEFFMHLNDMNFQEAISSLSKNNLSLSNVPQRKPQTIDKKKKSLIKPTRVESLDIDIINYLVERGVPDSYSKELINLGKIYGAIDVFGDHKNKMLVMSGEKRIEKVSIHFNKNSKYLVSGSDKSSINGFGLFLDKIDKTKCVKLFESGIDLISYDVLNNSKDKNNSTLLSTSGMPSKALLEILKNKNCEITACFDNDIAGENLVKKYSKYIDKREKPNNKDWNDDLIKKNLIKKQSGLSIK